MPGTSGTSRGRVRRERRTPQQRWRRTREENPAPQSFRGLDPVSATELGEVILGTQAGHRSPEERTVYKSMGHAVEDAGTARLVYDAARATGRGTLIDIGN